MAILLAGCAGQQRKDTDDRLAAIRFEGNRAMSHGTLVAGLALHRAQGHGRALDPYLVPEDAERIRGHYLRLGYLDVDVRSRIDRQGRDATVTYSIEEGKRAQTRVVIDGLPAGVSQTDVRAKLKLADGAPFDYEVYEAAKEPLLSAVKDAGYAHARLDADVFADRANHQAIVELHYDPGPLCHFGKVQIIGANGDLADSIASRVAFDNGDKFSNSALSKTQLALYGMKRFSTVRVDPDLDAGAEVPVKISVAEGAAHELKLGGGAGIDPATYEVRGRAGYTVVGWPWQLTTFETDLRPAYAVLRDGTGYEPRIRSLARLSRMDLFMTNLTGEIEGGYNFLVVEAYTSYGPRARIGISTPLFGSDRIHLRTGYQIERLDFRNISPLIDPDTALRLGLTSTEQLGALHEVISVEGRDHPMEPRLGAYAELRAAEGARYFGGNYQYLQLTPDARGYVPIGPVVMAARLRFGAIYGDVPVTERYYGGGVSSQRGFAERRLSPGFVGDVNGVTTSVPIGGSRMIETGIESRFPLGTIHNLRFGGVLFLDGGDVTESMSQLNVFHLHWAIGTGLRLNTVVGPVRFDIGYRLNRTGPGEPEAGSHFAFHLSLGEAY